MKFLRYMFNDLGADSRPQTDELAKTFIFLCKERAHSARTTITTIYISVGSTWIKKKYYRMSPSIEWKLYSLILTVLLDVGRCL